MPSNPHLFYDPNAENRAELFANSEAWPMVCASYAGDPGNLVDEFDPRTWYQKENQRQTNSCGGEGVAGSCETIWYLKTGQVIQLSPWFPYIEAQRLAGRLSPRNGIDINNGVKVAKQLGLPLEDLCPNTGKYYTTISQAAYADAQNHKLLKSYTSQGYAQLHDFLRARAGAGYIGIPWRSCMQQRKRVTRFTGSFSGWHAVTFNGFKANGDLVISNSHLGNEFIDVAPEAVEQIHREGLVILLSEMNAPAVREFDWSTGFLS